MMEPQTQIIEAKSERAREREWEKVVLLLLLLFRPHWMR